MDLSEANSLERKGQLLSSARIHFNLYSQGADGESFRRIYLESLRRILAKMDKDERASFVSELLFSDSKLETIVDCLLAPKSRSDMESNEALVTIIVPCYNCEKYLLATIKSILAQTYRNFECILIDDFSVDGTPKIAKDMTARDKRFRFFQHRANGGLAASRNTGIRLSKGKYVCFLDSDDLLAADSLKNRVHAIEKYSSERVVAGVFDFSETIPDDYSGEIQDRKTKYVEDYVDFISSKGDCPFNANQPLLKRRVLLEMGGFPENYPQAEDWRLWAKIFRSGYLFLPVRTIGSGYRQTQGSMIRRAPLLHLEKSSGNFYRAHNTYESEEAPLEVRYESLFMASSYFGRENGFYTAQRSFIPRLFNFIGIDLARLSESDEELNLSNLKSVILKAVPDFDSVVAGYTYPNMRSWMENGYKRFFGVHQLSPQRQEAFNKAAHLVLKDTFKNTDLFVVGEAKKAIPRRNLTRKEHDIVDVLFFPHKAYHTKSFELLLPLLKEKGLSFKFVDISVPYRDEQAYDSALDGHFISYNEFVLSRILPRSIVCMNDWDTVVRPVVKAANSCAIPTVGIVEGVQDFWDVDTGRKRNPYREVSNVLLPGEFDKKYFSESEQKLWVSGVQRLDGLSEWKELRRIRSPRLGKRKVLVNVNFSYGVLTDKRIKWLNEISEACDVVNCELIVSQHPQDDGDLSNFNVSRKNIYELLVDVDVFVSRFSGAILESLVIGCPTIYYNSHNEKVDKFHNSLGAYNIVCDKEMLISVLADDGLSPPPSEKFLAHHCDIRGLDLVGSSIVKTAKIIEEIVNSGNASMHALQRFKSILGGAEFRA